MEQRRNSKQLARGLRTLTRADVFLCHSHKDKRFVRRLATHLEGLSISVWYDDWELSVGDSLHRCIGLALERSSYVGVVLSPNSVASRWCQDELDQALTREKKIGRKVALPLLYRRVHIPPFLDSRLCINFSHSYLDALARLAGFLHQVPLRQLDAQLRRQSRRSYEKVQALIQHLRSTSPRAKILSKKQYKRFEDGLREIGLKIDPESFEIRTRDGTPIYCVDKRYLPEILKILEDVREGESETLLY